MITVQNRAAVWAVGGLQGLVQMILFYESEGVEFRSEEIAELRKNVEILNNILARLEATHENKLRESLTPPSKEKS